MIILKVIRFHLEITRIVRPLPLYTVLFILQTNLLEEMFYYVS